MIVNEPEAPTLKKEELPIDTLGIKKAAFLLKAVNHPVRQSMLQVIHRAGEITVTDLRLEVNLIQPVASSHLAVLRKANLVSARRERQRVLYAVHYDRLSLLQQKIQQFLR